MLKEFKEFALKGNMLDLAVGIVLGAAFGTIIDSLVKDVIMPPIGLLTGGKTDFSSKFVVLAEGATPGPYASLAAAQEAGANTLNYGSFVTAIIAFLIVAFALFLVVKGINRMRREQEAAPAPDPAPTREEELLTEIRDLLKTKP